MSAEPDTEARPGDSRTAMQRLTTRLWAWALVLALAGGFVFVGGGNLDLGPIEARLAISAAEGMGPYGQVYGGWEPAIWPAQVAPSVLWAWGEAGTPTAASVRWPAAIAGLLIGLILVRSLMAAQGTRAGLLLALCWFGSVALIDRSAGAGLDLIAGLATVAALDRMIAKGTDWVAGCWAALGFLAAGWPPLALLALTTVVLGRREAALSFSFLVPPALAAAGWSAWALSVAPAEAWAAALTLPLTEQPAWRLLPGVLALGLPWGPFAALAASRSVREGWTDRGRSLVLAWLQVAGASLVVGTVIPGLASAARLPALAGLAVAAAASLDRSWSGTLVPAARRRAVALAATVVGIWAVIAVAGGIHLAGAVSYYRSLAIGLILLTFPVVTLALRSVMKSDPRRAILALALAAACLKVAHWGYYVPEWDYRHGQGPWGRAIGQWVPPRWPIYTTHTWSPDLAFATGRPFRQLAHPKLLAFQKGTQPRHLLLLESEFTHWPEDAPRLVKVARFQDEHGATRVLARTEGVFSWRLARQSRDE